MLNSLNKDGIRIHANNAIKGASYFCPYCDKEVELRAGKIYAPYFAHKKDEACPYGADKDHKSPWHIRMQNLFPIECQEIPFKDQETGERHIADVFLPDSNIVIEFQKSAIPQEEFMKRTLFHLSEKRRIAWIFYECCNDPEIPDLGKLRKDDICFSKYPHSSYMWWRRRKILPGEGSPLDIKLDDPSHEYSVFLFTGPDDGNIIHRIVDESQNFRYVTISIKAIDLGDGFDPEDLFREEDELIDRMGMRESIEQHLREQEAREKARTAPFNKSMGICPECGAGLVTREGGDGLYVECSDFPHCLFNEAIDDTCPLCGKKLVIRRNKADNTRFIGCSGYPDCFYSQNDGEIPAYSLIR